ncbi:MAG: ABC transporter ATP-binding protein [Clostridia bacterium]|nr:ABC transporter ATP-binding protein [Clostridia bacterium]
MLKVRNLRKVYGQGEVCVEALRGIDFDVKPGEFVSIMGPSGSGKSTLMNILGCLDKSTDGVYELDGHQIQDIPTNELAHIRNKKIGFVFQSFNLLPKLTALHNVELPLIYMGIEKEERIRRAEEALKKVGLEDRMMHKPNEMSGGQKQRVAVARALATNPAIILADEPTGNLDSHSTDEILKLFESLNEEGKTIIIVTHEDDVAHRTKRMLVFMDGQLVKDEEVKHEHHRSV